MFGKRLSEYVRFHKVFLVAIAIVGLARLGLSVGGVSNATAAWLSMNVVVWAGALYAGVAVYTRGFGSYKQLLPLMVLETLVMQAIAVLGILLAIGGVPNVYAAPEFSFGAQSQWVHLLSHLTIGIVVPPFLLWGVASLVLFVTKKATRRQAGLTRRRHDAVHVADDSQGLRTGGALAPCRTPGRSSP